MNPKKLAIIGAGFSGLTLAWKLKKAGFDIEIFESSTRPGGLIQTHRQPVMVETAAHAFLASAEVENLFQELNLPMVLAGYRSRSKWIFRGTPRKWTLGAVATLQSIFALLLSRLTRSHWPGPQETVAAWIQRKCSREFSDYVASPALQGIYGTTSENLSASLILGRFFSKELRLSRGAYQSSLAPREGMGELIYRLSQKLTEHGVQIHFQRPETLDSLETQFDGVILATSIKKAAELLKKSAPIASRGLAEIPMISLSTVTVAFRAESLRVKGFGCLFPKKENFHSLGVLFNTDLFENRGPLNTETWIFNDDFAHQSEPEILQKINDDRRRLSSEKMEFDFHQINKQTDVLPLYGLALESFLESGPFDIHPSTLKIPALNVIQQGAKLMESAYPLYLTGNYLGAIGLTQILSYNDRLAKRIQAEINPKFRGAN